MKKGFTLAEILGVIVIIGLLLILIVPPIINRISGSGDEAKDAENEFIYMRQKMRRMNLYIMQLICI